MGGVTRILRKLTLGLTIILVDTVQKAMAIIESNFKMALFRLI